MSAYDDWAAASTGDPSDGIAAPTSAYDAWASTASADQTAPQSTGLLSDIENDYQKRLTERGAPAIGRYENGQQTAPETAVQLLGNVGAGTVNDAGGEVLKRLPYVSDALNSAVNGTANFMQNNPIAGEAADATNNLMGKYADWAKNNPRAAEDISGTANLATIVPAVGAAEKGGAVASDVGAAAANGVGTAAKAVASPLIGTAQPAIADLANLAKSKYGIELYAPQISDSPFMKYLDSATGKIPLSGGTATTEKQYGQLAQAVAGEIGAPNLSQDGFATARANFGKMYNQVANNTVALGDQKLLDGLTKIEGDAKTVVGNKVQPIIDLVRSKIDNTPMTSVNPASNDISTPSGLMSGQDYKQLTAQGTPLDRMMQSGDPNVAHYAQQVKNQLDQSLARAASPADFQTLKQADIGYAKMMKLKSLALAADPEGNVTPAKIASVLRNANRGNEFGDYPDNNLKELSDIATRMKPPPSSGSVERGLAMGSMIFPAERLMTGDLKGAATDVAAAGGIMGASRATQATLNSQWYKNMLLRSAQQTHPGVFGPATGNKFGAFLGEAAPYAGLETGINMPAAPQVGQQGLSAYVNQ